MVEKQAPEPVEEAAESAGDESSTGTEGRSSEGRTDKKRDRRRHYRRRRSREDKEEGGETAGTEGVVEAGKRVDIPEPGRTISTESIVTAGMITTLLPPPPTLISETIARYREDALFKEAFYSRKERAELEAGEEGDEEELMGEEGQEREEVSSESTPVSVADEDPAHPLIPPEEHHEPKEGETKGDEDQWNFSEELSNNNKNI